MKGILVDLRGEFLEDIDCGEDLFLDEVNEGLIHRVLCAELANRRVGLAKVKGRSEVRGSNRKPWSQKGTGHARAGSVKSPIWRGGGVVFGPVRRSYRHRTPKKLKRLGFRNVLTKFFISGNFRVIEDIQLEDSKTKELNESLYNLSLIRRRNESEGLKNNRLRRRLRSYRMTLITEDSHEMVRRLSRNIVWLKCLSYNRLNIVDLFYSHEIVIEKSVLGKLANFYKREKMK